MRRMTMASKAKRNTVTYTLIQVLCIIVMFMVVGYAGLLKMEDDFWMLFQWWGATVMLGLAFYPLSSMLFRRFDDRGYLFSKAIGLVVTGWLMWLLASLRILPFTTKNCYLCLGVCALCNYLGALFYKIYHRRKNKKDVRSQKTAATLEVTAEAQESGAQTGKVQTGEAQAGELRADEVQAGGAQAGKAQAGEAQVKAGAEMTESRHMQMLSEQEPYVIRDVQVKVLNVKPAKVKEVRFRTGTSRKRADTGVYADRMKVKTADIGVHADSMKVKTADTGGRTGSINGKTADSGMQMNGIHAETTVTGGAMESADLGVEELEKAVAWSEGRLHWERILCLELLFFILFTAFMYMKGFNPKAFGTEKMMDYGFMTSMFKTEYFPVEDFWFAGESLNYYYFGQYVMTFLTKMSFTTVSYGYNLALGTGFAFCASLVYALVCQIMKAFTARRKKKISGAVSHAAGALAAVAVTIAGNGHYIVFNKLVPMLWDILQIPGEKPGYWFPNSTRYIGYVPETHDKTIHEFPSYSFILGDVHAHVVNITFVLTLTAILFSFLMNRRDAMADAVKKRRSGEKPPVSIVRETFRLPVIAVGYLIGIFMMSNYWDFPIYFVVSGAVILVSNAVICGFDKRTWILTALHAVVVLSVAFLTALPFQMHFVAMANGILLAETHTPLYQLIILWGIQAAVVIGFVTALIFKEMRRGRQNAAGKRQNRCILFLENLEISDLFVLILGLCAIGLVLTPEVIYMSDIYAGDYKRSNTMFKLVYQAYILFGISIGYILTRFILLRETRRQLKWGVVGLVLLLWTCGYFGTSVRAWFGDITNEEAYGGMRADRYIFEEQPTDAAAIAWLNDNVTGRPVILEANGESYTISNRVSVLTGLPTVLGWRVHEWLWHNSLEPVSARAQDVDTIYLSQDRELVRALLDKYQVTYLFIGTCEYDKYGLAGMNTEMLQQMGEVVYEGYPDMQGRAVMIVKVR